MKENIHKNTTPLYDKDTSETNSVTCCLCGRTIEGYGNNPFPLSENEDDRCCDNCNWTKVIPARIAMDEDANTLHDFQEESRDTIRDTINDEICNVLYGDFYEELYEKIYEDLYEKIYEELYEKIYEELAKDLYESSVNELEG